MTGCSIKGILKRDPLNLSCNNLLNPGGSFGFPSFLDALIEAPMASDQNPLDHFSGNIIGKKGDLFHNLIKRDRHGIKSSSRNREHQESATQDELPIFITLSILLTPANPYLNTNRQITSEAATPAASASSPAARAWRPRRMATDPK